MILIDSSVWIDHFRRGDVSLSLLLESGRTCTHAFVVGELACGNLKSRNNLLDLLRSLPTLAAATDDEVLFFIERHQLMGQGMGYIDIHLLAAVAMNGATQLWTRDKRLAEIADKLGLMHQDRKH